MLKLIILATAILAAIVITAMFTLAMTPRQLKPNIAVLIYCADPAHKGVWCRSYMRQWR